MDYHKLLMLLGVDLLGVSSQPILCTWQPKMQNFSNHIILTFVLKELV